MVNYHSTSTQTNTHDNAGTFFPAFIRLEGYIRSTEFVNADKIGVFFDRLDHFADESPDDDYGKTKVACASSMDQKVNCRGFKASPDFYNFGNIHYSQRVEIEAINLAQTGLSSKFQILIPVALKSN